MWCADGSVPCNVRTPSARHSAHAAAARPAGAGERRDCVHASVASVRGAAVARCATTIARRARPGASRCCCCWRWRSSFRCIRLRIARGRASSCGVGASNEVRGRLADGLSVPGERVHQLELRGASLGVEDRPVRSACGYRRACAFQARAIVAQRDACADVLVVRARNHIGWRASGEREGCAYARGGTLPRHRQYGQPDPECIRGGGVRTAICRQDNTGSRRPVSNTSADRACALGDCRAHVHSTSRNTSAACSLRT